MRNFIRTTALAAALLAVFPAAQAAVQNYNFSGTLESNLFSGSFSFDDALLAEISPLLTVAPLMSFSMNYGSTPYSLADVWAAPDVSYYDGVFLGLSLSNNALTFIPGSFDATEAFVANDTSFGDVTYTLAAVPEPESYAMLLAGLGLMGVVARRRSLRV